MDCNIFTRLLDFRTQLYGCFVKAGDALFNIIDALLSETASRSLAELSLSPFCTRGWGSIYQGLQQAEIDRQNLQRLFAVQAPQPEEGKRLVLGIDASSIARPCSQTAKDRTYVHQSNLPKGCKPVTPGWQFSTLTVLPEEASSWTYILDNVRVRSEQTQGETAQEQLKAVLPLLAGRPLLLGDGYYSSVTFLELVADTSCDLLARLPKNRVLYRPAPPRTGKKGRPKLDGARFACKEPVTHGPPDAFWQGTNPMGQPMQVSVWHHLHYKKARQIQVSVLRIVRPQAKDTQRDPRSSWFLFRGEQMPAPSEVSAMYARRYSQEHGYRVDKQNLLWETPRLRTPEQFQHWTDLVACVRNQLYLARPLAQVVRQPWERKSRPLTPQQTRRAMPRILALLGTPARPPQPRGKSPGRRVGAAIKPVPRYKVIFKATEKNKKVAENV
jgi:hypothetical protein